MIIRFKEFEIDDDIRRMDLDRVHGWLTEAYWSRGVARETVKRAFRGARTVVGAYLDGVQEGCLRIISDGTTFGWIADVYVHEPHRGNGLGKAMVKFALEHPDYAGLKRWLLATLDAHGMYWSLGFRPLPNPEAYMIRGKASFD